MSLLSQFNQKCGAAPFSFEQKTVRKIGLGYVFKFGKYKGFSVIELLTSSDGREYLKHLYERGDITFTKKDDSKLRSLLCL